MKGLHREAASVTMTFVIIITIKKSSLVKDTATASASLTVTFFMIIFIITTKKRSSLVKDTAASASLTVTFFAKQLSSNYSTRMQRVQRS